MYWNMAAKRAFNALVLMAVVLITGSLFQPTSLPATAQDDGGVRIGLTQVADGLVAPVDLDTDGSGRLYIVDRPGVIYAIESGGGTVSQPFLDVRDRLVQLNSEFDERGLLSMALHPDFANNGRFFVFYSAPPRPEGPVGFTNTNILSEFTVSADTGMADPASERIVLMVDHPDPNHNGGDMAFGPDGFLYLSLGDGGGGNDEGLGHTEGIGNAQDLTTFHGKILRIDVDGGDPYGVPADNPFVSNASALPEIFAYGLRNPWRIDFDSAGNLYAADAGQELYEEVNIVTAGGNYGWRFMEGAHCFDPAAPAVPPETCDQTGPNGDAFINPVLEFDHMVGVVIVGGDLYEGMAMPDLNGQFIFGVWSEGNGEPNGRLFAAQPVDGALWAFQELVFDGTGGDEAGQPPTEEAEGEETTEPTEEAAPEGEGAETGTEGEEEPPSGGGSYAMFAPPGDEQTQDDEGEEEEAVTGFYILSVEADSTGELYILTTQSAGLTGTTGKVWRLGPAGEAVEVTEELPAPDTAAAPANPSLAVDNQSIAADGTVTIASVVSPGPGWVMIHADDQGYYGAPIGSAPVPAGQSTNVVVPIDTASATPVLHAMLHADAGVQGTLEFPGADAPITSAVGRVLNIPFVVLPTDPAQPITINVALDEFYAMAPPTWPAGMLTINVYNRGDHPHNLEVENEEMGVEVLLFENDLQPGESGTIQVELAPGSYEVYCPVDDHADFGMRYVIPVEVQAAAQPPAAEQPTQPPAAEATATTPAEAPQPTATTAEATPEAPTPEATAPEATAPATTSSTLAVQDQTISGDGTVMATVSVDAPAWLVIHADSSGAPGTIIGTALVPPGTAGGIVVPIQGDLVTEVLHAMLHFDLGEAGTFEFPGADVPMMDANGQMLVLPFTVTVAGS